MSAETSKAMITDHPERCRTCGARILWLHNNITRRVAPIDAEPADNGNIELLEDGTYRVLGQTLFDQRDPDTEYHLNHFATCEKPPERKS